MSLLNTIKVAHSGMQAQSVRLQTISSNLANANSVSSNEGHTYRSKQPVFQEILDAGNPANGGVKVKEITKSLAPLQKEYAPDHPQANEEGFIFKSNVNFVDEQANFIAAKASYSTQVELANSLNTLTQKTLQVGKR